jgi:hypothetical protein
VSQIQKFSLVYDPREDRIAFDGETSDGGTARLWLTQRLCKGLVDTLPPMLETKAQQALPREHKAAVQSFEQAAAVADFGKLPGVKPRPEAQTGLVGAVHMRAQETHVDLVFEFGNGQRLTLVASRPAVRQMLFVMWRLHQLAGWPPAAWPAWIANPQAPAPSGDAVN